MGSQVTTVSTSASINIFTNSYEVGVAIMGMPTNPFERVKIGIVRPKTGTGPTNKGGKKHLKKHFTTSQQTTIKKERTREERDTREGTCTH
jgi:hypothetical protein